MKCKICKQKTDWDSSYGKRNFLVCSNCFREMIQQKVKRTNKNAVQAADEILTVIFDIGDQVRRIKERS